MSRFVVHGGRFGVHCGLCLDGVGVDLAGWEFSGLLGALGDGKSGSLKSTTKSNTLGKHSPSAWGNMAFVLRVEASMSERNDFFCGW